VCRFYSQISVPGVATSSKNHIAVLFCDFVNIEGYDDVKDIVRLALHSDQNYNLLITDTPASAKTLFLLDIAESENHSIYFDGTNSTDQDGILDVLQEERPKIIFIDEINKQRYSKVNCSISWRLDVSKLTSNESSTILRSRVKLFATASGLSRLSRHPTAVPF
jgi:hypothetical protein